MEFEWDEAKAAANLAKHGVDFLDAALVLDDPLKIEIVDSRADYGETRIQCVGAGSDSVLFVVYTKRGENLCRLISARKANRYEQAQYAENRPLHTS